MIVVLGSVICLKKIYNNGIWAYAPLCHCHSNIFLLQLLSALDGFFFFSHCFTVSDICTTRLRKLSVD